LATFDLAKGDDELGSQRELGVVGNDQASSILEDQMHLALARVGDLDFDEDGIGDRPGLGGFPGGH
jgi:hypothetical protein